MFYDWFYKSFVFSSNDLKDLNFAILIFFILSTIGMCHIIVDGSNMDWFRRFVRWTAKRIRMEWLGGVVDCFLCCGTWCGFFMGSFLISHNLFIVFACGCAGGFISNLAASLLNLIEAATIVRLPED